MDCDQAHSPTILKAVGLSTVRRPQIDNLYTTQSDLKQEYREIRPFQIQLQRLIWVSFVPYNMLLKVFDIYMGMKTPIT